MAPSQPLPTPASLPAAQPTNASAPRASEKSPARLTQTGEWLARASFALGLMTVVGVSLLPGPEMPDLGSSDKAWHAFCYGVLAATGALAFRGHRQRFEVVAGLVAMGAALEALQTLVPGRDASFADALANAAGVIAGLAFAWLLMASARCIARRRSASPPRA